YYTSRTAPDHFFSSYYRAPRHLHSFPTRRSSDLARPVLRKAEGVQAADHVERVLEGGRAKRANAARLRHRLSLRQGAEGASEPRSEEHTSELQSRFDLVCRLLLEKKNDRHSTPTE